MLFINRLYWNVALSAFLGVAIRSAKHFLWQGLLPFFCFYLFKNIALNIYCIIFAIG